MWLKLHERLYKQIAKTQKVLNKEQPLDEIGEIINPDEHLNIGRIYEGLQGLLCREMKM